MTSTAARSLSGWPRGSDDVRGGPVLGAIQLFAVRPLGFRPAAAELAAHIARLTSVGADRWGGRPAR